MLAASLGACDRSTSAPEPTTPESSALRAATAAPVHASGTGDNILLITLDTTRADRLGCYGYEKGVTPTLDALAKRGTLFEQAMSQVPITLPSHCTILTGKYPREHGVLDNGRSRLAKHHDTLATIAQGQGYKTGAFVASFVLAGQFGLDRGFDEYNDDTGESDPKSNPFHRERPADAVTDQAIQWLESVKSEPFFGWVHYYDPHDPYAPPEEFAEVGAGPYDGEIAFVDAQLRRLMDWLTVNKLVDRTLVVVAGDHGESFNEHGERGHTIFLYNTNLHVPLIFAHPKFARVGRRVSSVVELADVFPTILDLFDWPVPAGISSRSLVPALAGGSLEPKPAYGESLYALHTFGWSEQRALITERWKYIASAKPELYERIADPHEETNVLDEQSAAGDEMHEGLVARFDAMLPSEGADVKLGASDRQKLAALGYLGGGGLSSDEFLTPDLLDPKDNMDIVDRTKSARRALHDKRYDVVVVLLASIVDRAPNSVAVHSTLGSALLFAYDDQVERQNGVGDRVLLTKAHDSFEKVLKLDASDPMALVSMGDVLTRQRRFAKAVKHYELALDGVESFGELHVKLAQALRELGRLDQAVLHYKKAIELDPEIGEAHYDLGLYYLNRGDHNTALSYFYEAVRHKPDDPKTRYNLGLALLRLDQFHDAVTEFETATELDPNYKDATINLGIALFKAGRAREANAIFIRATSKPAMAPEAYFNLAVAVEKQGHEGQAVSFYEKALMLKPDYAEVVDVLAGFYLGNNRAKEAVRVLRVGVQNNPGNVRFVNMLAKVLAMSSQEGARSGSEAVVLAERASKMTGGRHPAVLQTLAAAHAEAGQFERAVETARAAVELARAAKDARLVADLEAQLEGYLEGRPARVEAY